MYFSTCIFARRNYILELTVFLCPISLIEKNLHRTVELPLLGIEFLYFS
jgi:hypothetical protein